MRRVLVVLGLMFVLSTIAGAVCWGQQIRQDTATSQYHAHQSIVDSLARGAIVQWAGRLRLHGWTITVRADTLSSDIVAQTVTRDEYRFAEVTLDMRGAERWDFNKVIVHELLHVKISPYTAIPRMILGPHGGVLLWMLMRAEELLVTELTDVVLGLWATR